MNRLREYQVRIANKAAQKLRELKIVYIAAEVRTGKTLMALEVAKLYGAKSVLFLTKKKAIGSIESDYADFGYADHFSITVTNDESIHKVVGEFDLVVHDEHHRFSSLPKPGKITVVYKKMFAHLPMIFLSGTPTPESFSQIYHQFWVSNHSPFGKYINFYKWAKDFVNVYQINYGYGLSNQYDKARQDLIDPIVDPYFIRFTQKEAGFTTSVSENVLHVKMSDTTYKLAERLKKDLVLEGKDEVVIADTAVKLMMKLHQIYSGSIKFESGNAMTIDTSKAEFIRSRFDGVKIAIFYKFKQELLILKEVFGEKLCTELDQFNGSDKNIALQILSGREGISLSEARYLVYYNMDFSAVSFWQSRDRMSTMHRLLNDVYYVFSENGLEDKIYKAVLKKKDYTTKYFIKDARIGLPAQGALEI